ncbi:MAG: UDP-diphosphatase, partial [Acidobacteriota bacterium]|nr:UDP-diphosphatase [Acidobacteriota bacterium]
LAFKKIIVSEATKNLWVIGIMMISIAVLLTFAELVGSRRKSIQEFGLLDSLVQGFAQVLALIPGASRSGSTIMGGLFAGQKREAAARFSFLLSIPAVGASGILELKEAIQKNLLSSDDFVALGVGTLIAGIVGYFSIWFLLAFLRKNSTAVFIVYRIILGTVILVLVWQNVINPNIN